MKRVWLTFAIVIFLGIVFFSLPLGQRQEIAKYMAMCLIFAFFLRPIGLTIGRILGKLLNRD